MIRGTYNRELCAALAKSHDVRTVAPVRWPDAVRARDLRTGDDPELPIARPPFWFLPRMAPRLLGGRLFAAMRRGVRQVGRDWTPDLVVSYWLYPDAWAAQRLADDFGCAHATIVGGSDVLHIAHEAGRGPLARDVLRRCDVALAVSRQLVDAVADVEPAAHAAVWSQGIRTEVLFDGPRSEARRRLGWPDDGPLFLFVGRLAPVKALPRLLDAFAALQTDVPSRLAIVGSGPESDRAIAHARAIGVSGRVLFPGPIAPAKLGDCYRACDAVVLSSDSEGLPNVLREGLACGRPFASSDVGGISEIGDDTCRTLAAPGDADALADAMRDVLSPAIQDGATRWPVRTWDDAADDLLAAVRASASNAAASPTLR